MSYTLSDNNRNDLATHLFCLVIDYHDSVKMNNKRGASQAKRDYVKFCLALELVFGELSDDILARAIQKLIDAAYDPSPLSGLTPHDDCDRVSE